MPEPPAYDRVKVMGERGSGTNFLARLVTLNFKVTQVINPDKAEGEDAPLLDRILADKRRPWIMSERIQDFRHETGLAETAGWKHACLTDRLFEVYRHGDRTLFLCILRHPALWLRSLLDKPFHNFNHPPGDLDELIDTPWMTRERDETGVLILESPVLLWRLKAESYLAQAAKRDNVLVLRHEALLADHKACLDRLGALMAPKMQLKWRLPKGYARNWLREDRPGVDFHSIRKTLPEDPFTVLTPDQAGRVRALIGADLLSRAGYGGQP